MKIRPLATFMIAAIATSLVVAKPAPAQSYNANCETPTAEQRATIEATEVLNIRFKALDRMLNNVCKLKETLVRVFNREPDPEKVTNDMIFEAAKPEIDPVTARKEWVRSEKAAEERMKAREEAAQRARRNGNPANEAVTARNEQDAGERVQTPQPLTPAAAGETPAAPEPVILPPTKKGGFITVFEGRQDSASGPAVLNGEGTAITSDGIQSGTFKNNELQGEGQEVTPDGTWRGGNFENGEIEGQGFEVREEGDKLAFVEADFKDDKPEGIVTVTYEDGASRHDLWSRGRRVAEGQLAAQGVRPIDPVVKSPEMLAAEADADFERKLQSLPTASALFALADELAEKGDISKARRTYRSLMTRFPSSRLAALSAERLTTLASRGDGTGQPNRANSGGTVAQTSVRTSPTARYSSICTRDAEKLVVFSSRRPEPWTPTFSKSMIRFWARCAAYDPVAAQETQNKKDELRDGTRIGYPDVVGASPVNAEIERAITNLDYSAELGPVRIAPR